MESHALDSSFVRSPKCCSLPSWQELQQQGQPGPKRGGVLRSRESVNCNVKVFHCWGSAEIKSLGASSVKSLTGFALLQIISGIKLEKGNLITRRE